MSEFAIFVSKLLPALVYPLNAALWLALLALILILIGRRRLPALLLFAAISILWTAATPTIASRLVAGLEARHPPLAVDATPRADVIVLLGGGIGLATPPRLAPDLQGGADRVLHAARLFRAGRAPLVIVSAGNVFAQPQARSEAEYTAELLQEWGVPETALAIEGDSRNTRENAVQTRALMQARGLRTALLVTSAMHMPRAVATFRSAGIEVVACPTDFQIARYDVPFVLRWLPSAGALAATSGALKEHMGLVVYRWRGWLIEPPRS